MTAKERRTTHIRNTIKAVMKADPLNLEKVASLMSKLLREDGLGECLDLIDAEQDFTPSEWWLTWMSLIIALARAGQYSEADLIITSEEEVEGVDLLFEGYTLLAKYAKDEERKDYFLEKSRELAWEMADDLERFHAFYRLCDIAGLTSDKDVVLDLIDRIVLRGDPKELVELFIELGEREASAEDFNAAEKIARARFNRQDSASFREELRQSLHRTFSQLRSEEGKAFVRSLRNPRVREIARDVYAGITRHRSIN